MKSLAFHIMIPARFESTRFPGKLMANLGGMTIIERVYRQALLANAESITIATDNLLLAEHARGFGAKVVMTAANHQSGSDRIAEAISLGQFTDEDIIVNVQGDEPFMSPELITQVASNLASSNAPVATLCWPIVTLEQFNNPNVVKVVRNCRNEALYFSRSPIPLNRDNKNTVSNAFRHIGLYAYRAHFLKEYVSWPPCALETMEALEQLRILDAGFPIHVDVACIEPLQDINTPEDLALMQQMLA
jgi:3-deoxy-manno-octulosonate cytidylyltransferase (CMP-KDO synthetase)